VASRPISQLAADFPDGADFLVAHNVLEHAPNPIGQLVQWNASVRDGGTVVLSLPHYRYCPDSGRPVPPLAHLVEDYLASADGRDFVSREHGASFLLGWWQDFCAYHQLESVAGFTAQALVDMHLEHQDLHWHAFDTKLTLGTVHAAAFFAGVESDVL